MPFNRTPNPPPPNPKVTIMFVGLILLKPDANNGCEIGIHRFSSIHEFQVILAVHNPAGRTKLIRLLKGPLQTQLSINVTPDPGTGVQAFALNGPFNRPNPNNDPLDHRWALNLRIPHPGADFNDGARPIATLNAGVLYSSSLTAAGLDPELVQGTSRTPMIRLAADLAAAIDLPAASNVALSWREFGDPRSVILPRRMDPPATTYSVVLMNDPLSISPPDHEELPLYYKVLEIGGAPIPPPLCRLVFNGDPSTDEIPCMPIILNP